MVNFQKPPKPQRPTVYNPFEEMGRIPKTAVEQVTGSAAKGTPEPAAALQPEVPPEEIVEAQHKARLKKLREEVEQIRQKKREEEKGKRQPHFAEASADKQNKPQPILEPQGKRPRGILVGMMGLLKRKQSKEIGKTPAQ